MLLPLAAMALAGCGAPPTIYAFGSYFPAWMLCGLLGIAAALIARALFVATGLAQSLPHQLLICSSAGVIVALLVWLVVYG
ncbi:MAG TPA: YtcA family lipoprotein [Rhizomicrobium sp.]